MFSENVPPTRGHTQPVMVSQSVISSTVLGVTSWWMGSNTNHSRSFKADDIFSAWCKLKEVCQVAAGQPVTAPTKHRTESKLAEELVKDISEVEKNGAMTLVIPSTELGLVKGLLESNVSDERQVATKLESLEDMVKGVVERLTRMEANQAKAVRTPQPVPVVQTPAVVSQQVQTGQQQSFAAVNAAGLTRQVQQLLVGTTTGPLICYVFP